MSDDLTYGSYLRIPELLSLQQCRSVDPETGRPEHDETLFIVIHQVYELWFKQVLHELDELCRHLNADAPSKGTHQLKRVLKILKTLVAQLDVLETMTPLEFASFRPFLESASGFQSSQFRELELLLGQFDVPISTTSNVTPRPATGWSAGCGSRPSGTPSSGTSPQRVRHSDSVIERDVTLPHEPSAEVQATLVGIYRSDPALMEVCELLTDFDEGFMEWRYRHVMMVQRTIGTKQGTGGSDGASYLRTTIMRPAFADLWAIRTSF